jgi:hypothetical protein
MQVTSHKNPQKVELRQEQGKVREYFLRDNITEEQVENEQGDLITQYKYDEVRVKLVNRANIEDYINNNFYLLFEQGQLEEQTPDNPSAEERISELEDTILSLLEV